MAVVLPIAVQVNDIHAAVHAPISASVPVFVSVECRAPSENFTGRESVLSRLHTIFGSSNGRRIVTLAAHGGAGKTQVALKFAEQSQQSRL